MPYQASERLPAERASRISHLEVIKSELVNKLCESFESSEQPHITNEITWQTIKYDAEPLKLIFGIDGL